MNFALLLIPIIALISIIPKLDSKNIFNISLITNGYLNIFVLLSIIGIISIESYKLGIFLFILIFTLIYVDPNNIIEGFIPYYNYNQN